MSEERTKLIPSHGSDWIGHCSGCGCSVTRSVQPPPCHVNRLKCDECKKRTHMLHARAWSKRNHGYEAKRQKLPHRKRAALEGSLRRNRGSQSNATQSGQRWGDVEDCWLLKNAKSMTEAKLADCLGRSIKSIEARLWRLRSVENENA